jgi:hypothetical protein
VVTSPLVCQLYDKFAVGLRLAEIVFRALRKARFAGMWRYPPESREQKPVQ